MKDYIHITVVGDDYTGKTCLLTTYTTNTFKEGIVPTVGCDFLNATAMVNGKQVKLFLMGAFRRFIPEGYPGTDVFVVLFKLNDRDNFASVRDTWYAGLRQHYPEVPIILVGTWLDLRGHVDNLITHSQGLAMAKDIGAMKYIECSSKTKEGVKTVFDTAIEIARGGSLLHYADNVDEMIQMLLTRGNVDINFQDINNETPLFSFARKGDLDVTELLLRIGADRNIKKDGKSPEEVAMDKDTKALFSEIPELGDHQHLPRALVETHWTSAAVLVELGAPIDSIADRDKQKILQTALCYGPQITEIEKKFIEKASIEDHNSDGNTLLHLAVRNCMKGWVNILISSGSFVEVPNNEGNTPLHIAASTLDVDIVRILLSNGASVYSLNNEGNSPLDIAG